MFNRYTRIFEKYRNHYKSLYEDATQEQDKLLRTFNKTKKDFRVSKDVGTKITRLVQSIAKSTGKKAADLGNDLHYQKSKDGSTYTMVFPSVAFDPNFVKTIKNNAKELNDFFHLQVYGLQNNRAMSEVETDEGDEENLTQKQQQAKQNKENLAAQKQINDLVKQALAFEKLPLTPQKKAMLNQVYQIQHNEELPEEKRKAQITALLQQRGIQNGMEGLGQQAAFIPVIRELLDKSPTPQEVKQELGLNPANPNETWRSATIKWLKAGHGIQNQNYSPFQKINPLVIVISLDKFFYNEDVTVIDFKKLDEAKIDKLDEYLDQILPKSSYEIHRKNDANLAKGIDVFKIINMPGDEKKGISELTFKLLPARSTGVTWIGTKKVGQALNVKNQIKKSGAFQKAAFVLTPKSIFGWLTSGTLFATKGKESELHTLGAYPTKKPAQVIKDISVITGIIINFNVAHIKEKGVLNANPH